MKVREMSKNKRIVIGVLIAVFLVYISGVFVFSQKVYPNTKLSGNQIEMVDKSGLQKVVNELFDKQTIAIKDDVVSNYEPKLSELGASINAKSLAADIEAQQNVLLWPLQIFKSQDYNLTNYIEIDNGTLNGKLIDAGLLDEKKRQKSKNAKLKFDKDSSEYVITKEVNGNVINDEFISDLQTAITDGESEFDASKYYIEPKVVSDDLKSDRDALNKRIKRTIKVNFGNEQYQIPKAQVANFIFIDDDGKVDVDNTNLYNYLSDVAGNYSKAQQSGNKRVVTTYDVNSAYYAIESALLTDENTAITVDATKKTFNQDKLQKSVPTSGTYIEVSISQQYMWLYNDGKLVVKTPIVTGNVAEGWDTPTGTFSVWNKETDKVLDGATVGYDYKVPVDYWMAIDYTGVGIHDIDWLTSENAESSRQVYKTDGSHGCINTPDDVMKKVYDNTPIGTPVYVMP